MGSISIFHWLVLAFTLAIFAVPIWFAVSSARRRPESGFAGWLFLLAVGQVLFVIQALLGLLQFLPLPGNFDTSIPGAIPAYTIEGMLHLGLAATALTTTVTMFRYRHSFRQWFTAQWIAAFLIVLLDVLLVALWFGMSTERVLAEFGGDLQQAGLSALVGAVVVAYVWRSRRVTNTFTR